MRFAWSSHLPHFPDTEEVTGSIPVSRTRSLGEPCSRKTRTGLSRCALWGPSPHSPAGGTTPSRVTFRGTPPAQLGGSSGRPGSGSPLPGPRWSQTRAMSFFFWPSRATSGTSSSISHVLCVPALVDLNERQDRRAPLPRPASSGSTPSHAGRQNRIRKFDRRHGCPSGVHVTNGSRWESINCSYSTVIPGGSATNRVPAGVSDTTRKPTCPDLSHRAASPPFGDMIACPRRSRLDAPPRRSRTALPAAAPPSPRLRRSASRDQALPLLLPQAGEITQAPTIRRR
jgi:hypothetical protein